MCIVLMITTDKLALDRFEKIIQNKTKILKTNVTFSNEHTCNRVVGIFISLLS